MSIKNQKLSFSKDPIFKMKDLELNRDYAVIDISKSKYVYVCTAVDAGEAELTTDCDFKRIQPNTTNIRFWSNKTFNDFMKTNGVIQCYIKLTKLESYNYKGDTHASAASSAAGRCRKHSYE
jgi:hypothetical protein